MIFLNWKNLNNLIFFPVTDAILLEGKYMITILCVFLNAKLLQFLARIGHQMCNCDCISKNL